MVVVLGGVWHVKREGIVVIVRERLIGAWVMVREGEEGEAS